MAKKKPGEGQAAPQHPPEIERALQLLRSVPADVKGAKGRLQELTSLPTSSFLAHRLLVSDRTRARRLGSATYDQNAVNRKSRRLLGRRIPKPSPSPPICALCPQSRVLYHEASAADAEARLPLLREALNHAKRASALCPRSLSCAALRATLAINTLVEESNGSAPASAAAFRAELSGAIAACTAATAGPSDQIQEPVITINDGTSQSCDPCSLVRRLCMQDIRPHINPELGLDWLVPLYLQRVQDQIQGWVREGRWDLVAQERACVLQCMQQVLQSCHTLLDSTSIPVDGVVRLLQHILRSLLPHRPMQQDLQAWANQLLGKGMSLDDIQQQKMDTQTAVGELLKLLRPTGVGALPDAQMLLQCQQTLLQQSQALQQQLALVQAQQQQQQQLSGQQPNACQAPSKEPVLKPQNEAPARQPQQQQSQQPQQNPAQRRQKKNSQAQALTNSPLTQQQRQELLMQYQQQYQQQQQQMLQQVGAGPSSMPQHQPQQTPVRLSEERDWDWDKVGDAHSGHSRSRRWFGLVGF